MKKKELLRKIEELEARIQELEGLLPEKQRDPWPVIPWRRDESTGGMQPWPMAPTIWLGEEVKLSGTIKTASSMNTNDPSADWYITHIDDPLTFTV